MPAVSIEIRQQYSQETEIALIDAVHSALQTVFRLPEYDRDLRLIVHQPHRFQCPSHLSQPEYFTQICIDCFAGRSLDTKRELYRTLVENLGTLGIPKDHIKIILREIPMENWGIRGGQAACDVNLGFDIQV